MGTPGTKIASEIGAISPPSHQRDGLPFREMGLPQLIALCTARRRRGGGKGGKGRGYKVIGIQSKGNPFF